jgi:hypothetical protein
MTIQPSIRAALAAIALALCAAMALSFATAPADAMVGPRAVPGEAKEGQRVADRRKPPTGRRNRLANIGGRALTNASPRTVSGAQMVRVGVAAALAAVAVTAPGANTADQASGPPASSPGPPAPAPSIARPFSASSFWNKPLADDAPLDPMSAAYNAELRRQLDQWMPWINTTSFSTPLYTVPAGQPPVRVKLDNTHSALQAAWERVPIPPGAKPATGSDAWMVVSQPSTDTMWEFWGAEKRADGWHARYGGRMQNVSSNPGHFTEPPSWGATATSLPLLGGLMRLDELKAGRIDHALAMAIPQPKARAFSLPAQRTDGKNESPNAIPEGTRFRIDPRLDLSKLKMAPIVRQMAVAAQRYGIVVRDTAGSVAFYAEDPTPTGKNPFSGASGYFGGQYPNKLLAQFPWEHLQALRTDIRTAPIR